MLTHLVPLADKNVKVECVKCIMCTPLGVNAGACVFAFINNVVQNAFIINYLCKHGAKRSCAES